MTEQTKWTHLPCAVHIDKILLHLKTHPGKWSRAARIEWDPIRNTRRDPDFHEKRKSAWATVWNIVNPVIKAGVWGILEGTTWDTVMNADWDTSKTIAKSEMWDRLGKNGKWAEQRDAAWESSWATSLSAAKSAAWDAAWSAIATLLAYDHASDLMSCTPDQIKELEDSGDIAARLIKQAINVMHEEKNNASY